MTCSTHQAGGDFQILTGAGPAAIAVIRVRGPDAAAFFERHVRPRSKLSPDNWQSGQVWRAELLDADGAVIDDILVSVHAGPPAWNCRLHLHGNPWLVRHCAEMLRGRGLTAAVEERSTLWTGMDAIEAEAYALLPRMLTLRGARWLMAQADRLRGAVQMLASHASLDAARDLCRQIARRFETVGWFAQPLRVVLAGPPNAGKSTLMNALADRPVSVVSPTPGTTRDWVEATGEANGFPVTWLDTAGLREGGDAVEAEGVDRTRRLMQQADATLLVLDATEETRAAQVVFLSGHRELTPVAVALNKVDAASDDSMVALRDALPAGWQAEVVPVSAMQRTGLDALCGVLLTGARRNAAALDDPCAFTDRQLRVLMDAAGSLNRKAFTDKMLELVSAPPTP